METVDYAVFCSDPNCQSRLVPVDPFLVQVEVSGMVMMDMNGACRITRTLEKTKPDIKLLRCGNCGSADLKVDHGGYRESRLRCESCRNHLIWIVTTPPDTEHQITPRAIFS